MDEGGRGYMPKLNYFTFKNNQDLMSDPMIKKAIERLEKRWKKIADYHKENNPETICKECGNEEFEYKHNRAICTNCGNEVEKEIEHKQAVKIGCATRTLSGCLREIMGSELAKKAKEAKPSEEELRSLPIDLENFSDVEYTESEIKYLNRRYQQLLDEIGRGNQVDTFMVNQLVRQELKIMNMNRKDQFNNDVSSTDRKREMKIYRDLVRDLKAAKSNREDVEDKTIIQEMAEKAKEIGIDKEIKEHVEYLNNDFQEYLEEAEERKQEVGNPY